MKKLIEKMLKTIGQSLFEGYQKRLHLPPLTKRKRKKTKKTTYICTK